MLQSIRDRMGIGLAISVLVLLVVPFVISSLYGYVSGGGGPQTVAEVNGEEISRSQLDQAFQQRQAELRRMLGDQFDPALFDNDQLRRETLQQLIDRQVLLGYVRANGLRVSDKDVADAVRSQEIFQVDGAFSADRYRRVLQQNGLTPERYEGQLRQDLALSLLQRSLRASSFTPDPALDRVIALQRQRRELRWVTLSLDRYRDRVSVTEADLEAHYKANPERYRQPEQVQLRYLVLDPAVLAESISVDEQAINDRYAERQAQVQAESSRAIRHILVAVDAEADATAVEAAREAAMAARERIVAGESFAQVAEAVSDDTGSAANGGSLGVLERTDVVDGFAEAAWALDPGEISEPVRTQFGFHIIEVTDIQDAELAPLAELRGSIRDEIARARAERQVFELGNELETLAFENPQRLTPAAEALGVEVKQSGWIPREGTEEGIGAQSAVLEAAFSEAVLERRENSDLLELSQGRYAVIRVEDYKPAALQPLEAVRESVRTAVVEEKAEAQARADAQRIREALSAGRSMPDAADEIEGVSVNGPRWSRRNDRELPAGVREAGFRLAADTAGQGQSRLARTADGWAVVTVEAVENGDPQSLSAEQREQLRGSLNDLDGQVSMRAVRAALREAAEVRVYEDNI